MKAPADRSSPDDETDADRMRGILSDNALLLDLVSAIAGDRSLSKAEKDRLEALKHSRGLRFFSDLLYSITHQYFPPETAEDAWNGILQHKFVLSRALGRNVRIAVAALDYFSNITGDMLSATLVTEANIGEIVGLSLRDGLTGLFNHTYFHQQIDLEVRRFLRYGALVSLALMDIDDFKRVNDKYGHPEGDNILASMGKTLLRVARDSDICCRYGGEEFAVILPLTDISEAFAIADRFRTELAVSIPGGWVVTLSIGVATCNKETLTFRDLVKKADNALYRVKRSGKNRVEAGSAGEPVV